MRRQLSSRADSVPKPEAPLSDAIDSLQVEPDFGTISREVSSLCESLNIDPCGEEFEYYCMREYRYQQQNSGLQAPPQGPMIERFKGWRQKWYFEASDRLLDIVNDVVRVSKLSGDCSKLVDATKKKCLNSPKIFGKPSEQLENALRRKVLQILNPPPPNRKAKTVSIHVLPEMPAREVDYGDAHNDVTPTQKDPLELILDALAHLDNKRYVEIIKTLHLKGINEKDAIDQLCKDLGVRRNNLSQLRSRAYLKIKEMIQNNLTR